MAKLKVFGFEFSTNVKPEDYIDELQEPIRAAATKSFRDIADLAKKRLRQQVSQNFRTHLTGRAKFENSFRSYAYPDIKKTPKNSLSPAVSVQANPAWAEVFEEGYPKSISPRTAKFLAIPTDEAEDLGLDKVGMERGWLRRLSQTRKVKGIGPTAVVKTDKGIFLTAKKDERTLFLFTLVRNVTERRRLSLVDITETSMRCLDDRFAKHLDEAQK